MEHNQIKYIFNDEVHYIDINDLKQEEVGTIIKFLEINKIYEFEYIIGEAE